MPRVAINIETLAGSGDPAAIDPTFTVGDNVENHYWDFSPGDILLCKHNGVSGGHACTLVSVADEQGRLGADVARVIGAGDVHVFGPLKLDGWVQGDGTVHVDVDSTDMGLCVLRGA